MAADAHPVTRRSPRTKKPLTGKAPLKSKSADIFPIVGIGASAGGLEAFGSFFSKMPVDSGMAFVLVQHLDPSHVSNMVDLLKRYTQMPVIEARDGLKIEVNHVYMIPPNYNMTVIDRTLNLVELVERPGISHGIDLFFRSLAADLKDRSICVILSGTGSDGSLGAKVVKAELGMVMVQDPESAKYDGMPRSAIAAGVADIVVPAEQMAEKLIDFVSQSYGKPAERRRQAFEKTPDSLHRIFAIIRTRVRHDFSQYKLSIINRRIERRMSVNQIEKIDDYVRLLLSDAHEVDALVKDFLINVTSFFRDPEAFESLKSKIKEMIQRKGEAAELRVWVPACSSGEEAYSLAIIIDECREELGKYPDWHVFGTDLDKDAIVAARSGEYQANIQADVSPERLKKYFTLRDGRYQIIQQIREKLVFAVQDIVIDPPFSKIDVIAARNLLIYFDSDLQKKIIPMFNYALNDGGLLFLGTAETIGGFGDMLSVLDRKWKIYESHKRMASAFTPLNTKYGISPKPADSELPLTFGKITGFNYDRIVLKAMLPSVVVDRDFQILYVHGKTGKYLQFPEGELSVNLVKAAREELRLALTTSLAQAVAQNREVDKEGLPIKVNGDASYVSLRVKPVQEEGPARLVVSFEDFPSKKKSSRSVKPKEGAVNKDLEQDLQLTRESLRSTIEELETANEELRSSNEEYQSTNEELNSANEELETSREELQSINEELTTVNTEYQKNMEELSTVADDMKNLLNNTGIATLFLDRSARIKRYTPAATEILNIIATDIGRPIEHLTSILTGYDIAAVVKKVLDTLTPVSQEVQTKDGRWYSVRVRPYSTADNTIAGAVVSFLDIGQEKGLEKELDATLDTLRESVLVLDAELRITSANRRFYQTFKAAPENTIGKPLYQIGARQWDIPELRRLLEVVLPNNSQFEDFLVEREFPGIGIRKMLLNARQIFNDRGAVQKILLALDDVTGLKPM